MKTIVVSCGGRKCCPKIHFDIGTLEIEDDYGGKVKLSNRQAKLVAEQLLKEVE